MASRRNDPGGGGVRPPERGFGAPEPEVGPASGGHLTPDVQPTGPLFEAAADPGATVPVGRSDVYPGAGRRSSRTSVRRRVALRRVRRTLRHVDPLSVFKLSLFFYGIAVLFWMLLVAIAYSIVSSMGLFKTIEEFSKGFALGWKVDITLFWVEKWAFFIGLVFALIGALLNLLLSFLYNVGADTIGGIEMTFVERDSPN